MGLQTDQSFGEHHRLRMGESGEYHLLQFGGLLYDAFGDVWMGMSVQRNPPRANGVDVAVSVFVVQHGIFGLHDGDAFRK
jgi:hypothetical protein